MQDRYNPQVEWNRQTPKDGDLFNKEFVNLYSIVSSFGSNFYTKTVTDNITLTEQDILENQLIFIKPSAASATIKLPANISKVGKITFMLLSTEGLTASLTTSGNEQIINPVGRANSFAYYDLMLPNEGVSLLYGNNGFIVTETLGLPKRHQVGQVDFLSLYKDELPTGCLIANGAELKRDEYRRLFDVIGVNFGAGDGTTTFLLPNLEQQFVRGYKEGVTIKLADRPKQDTMRRITGQFWAITQWDYWDNNVEGAYVPTNKKVNNISWTKGEYMNGGPLMFDSAYGIEGDEGHISEYVGSETAPMHVTLVPVIYF